MYISYKFTVFFSVCTHFLRYLFVITLAVAAQSGLYAQASDSCFFLQAIEITGNRHTKPRAILQEMFLQKNESYCTPEWQRLLKLDKERIYGTALFDTVSIQPTYYANQQVKLQIFVKERWYIYPEATLRVTPFSFQYWWTTLKRDPRYVAYSIGLTHSNLRGLTDKMRVLLQFGNEQGIRLSYRWPFVKKKNALWGYGVYVLYKRARQVFYNTEGVEAKNIFLDNMFGLEEFTSAASLSYRPKVNIRHRFSLGISYRTIADTIASLNSNYLRDNRLRRRDLDLVYSLEVDKRKQLRYPLSGDYFYLRTFKSGLGIFREQNLWFLESRYGRYRPVRGKWYLSQLLRLNISLPLRQAFVDYSVLNQSLFVRGYEKYLIQSPIFVHTNIILKRQLFKTSLNFKAKGLLNYLSYIPLTSFAYVYANYAWAKSYPSGGHQFTDTALYSLGMGAELLTFYDALISYFYAFTRHGQSAGFYIRMGGGN